MKVHNAAARHAAHLEADMMQRAGILVMWTVYDHPLDFPLHFVVRRHFVKRDAGPMAAHIGSLCQTLEEAREQIPQYATWMHREPNDDPSIVETWL